MWRYGVPFILAVIVWWQYHRAASLFGIRIRGLQPVAVAVDRKGHLYVADTGNHCVWRVDPQGQLERVAGNGKRDYSEDGGKATKASLSHPSDVAVDAQGNLYIADAGTWRIRKVDTQGTITTVGGGGRGESIGEGRKAVQVWLPSPHSIAIDTQGNLYILQTNNPRVRKVDRQGIITTVAGGGQRDDGGEGEKAIKARLSPTGGIAVDNEGNLHITEYSRIRKVDKTGIITTVAGNGRWGVIKDGGQALQTSLGNLSDVAFDTQGTLYIALHGAVCKVDKTGVITVVAGGGQLSYVGRRRKALEAELGRIFSIAVDMKGNLYAADIDNKCVIKVDSSGIVRTVLSAEGSLFVDKKEYW
ncbi:MAG: hypothetical protein NZT92_15870 [Abditibacteriales bacterium]|nr:hypothetical protein [Abditibacteriales bacterium]